MDRLRPAQASVEMGRGKRGRKQDGIISQQGWKDRKTLLMVQILSDPNTVPRKMVAA